MAVVFTVVFIVTVMVCAYFVFNDDDNHDEWRGW